MRCLLNFYQFKIFYMKKKLLLLGCLFLSMGTINAQESADKVTLVSESVKVPTNSYYRMFIKEYNQKMKDAIAAGKKITVRYESEDESIITGNGNTFLVSGEGNTNVTMKIATAKPGTIDAFDPDNVLATTTFAAEAEMYADMLAPTVSILWGQTREECIASKTADGSEILATKTYWEMNPSVEQEYRERYEVFFTSNFEFPVRMCYFNKSQEKLISETLAVASWERCQYPKISPVYKMLVKQGFEDKGFTEQNSWLLYNKESQTEATVGMMILQGASYYYVSFTFNPNDPNGIDADIEVPEVGVRTEGDVLMIDASKYAGKDITIYDMAGKVVASEIAAEGGNQVAGLGHQVVLVKVANCLPIKVML